MEKNMNEQTNLEKKDRSSLFLKAAIVVFAIAALVYDFVISPMFVNIDMYQRANWLYENESYKAASKLYYKLGDYKDSKEKYWETNQKYLELLLNNYEYSKANKLIADVQEQNKNASGETKEQVYYLSKETEKHRIREYIINSCGEDPEMENVLLWYYDMDGDGFLEGCQITANGLKQFYTYKNGEVIRLGSIYDNYYSCNMNGSNKKKIKKWNKKNMSLLQCRKNAIYTTPFAYSDSSIYKCNLKTKKTGKVNNLTNITGIKTKQYQYGNKNVCKISWSDNNTCSVHISYATKKDFSDKKNIYTGSNYCTLKNLTAGKTYYIKVRAYSGDEKKCSSYSKVYKVKIKK